MWGRGLYAAVNAAYSVSYASPSEDGKHLQMFAVVAALGRVCDMSAAAGGVRAALIKAPEGFDSVQGFTNGSAVHVVYETQRMLPAYVLTFKK